MDVRRFGVGIATVVLASALLPAQLLPGDAGPILGSGVPAPSFFAGAGEPASPPERPLLVRVFYHANRDDEFVAIRNPTPTPWDVGNWTLTDGEGIVTIPSGTVLGSGEEIVLTYNATSYREDLLRTPDFTYRHGDAPRAAVSGSFLLRNEGDEVVLRDPSGTAVDVFAYGTSPYVGPGWSGPPAVAVARGKVAVRSEADGVLEDTDTAADWDRLRSYGLGQSSFGAPRWTVAGTVRPFLAPDESLAVLTGYLDNATRTIDWSTYQLDSGALEGRLRSAIDRGVAVRILLEGQPVAGIGERTWRVASNLSAAGAHVRFLADDRENGTLARYRFNHAKFAVMDARVTIVLTENGGDHGFPVPPGSGNRGWGVAVEDATVAAWYVTVFEEDFNPARRDSVAFADFAPDVVPHVEDPWPIRPLPAIRAGSPIAGTFEVWPVLGPDTTLDPDGVRGLLAGASRTLHIEQFYVHPTWGSVPSPYLADVLEAARRGVSVRILLDDSPYNAQPDDPNDNDDAVAWLAGIAAAEGLDLEAKLGRSAAHSLLKFHTKGIVVDGEAVVVSSVNWNRNSVTNNREVGIVVRHPEVAAFFEDAFAWDWKDDVVAPRADAGPDLVGHVDGYVVLSGSGSWDDQGIDRYEWDLDGDGLPDRTGRTVTVRFRAPGVYLVRLRVTDRTGNADDDVARIEIVATVDRPGDLVSNPLLGPLLLLGVLNAAMFARMFSRRRRKGKGINGEAGMKRRGDG